MLAVVAARVQGVVISRKGEDGDLSNDIDVINAAAASLREKLNTFAATLTADEYTLLAQLLERGSRQDGEDTSGYWWWFFQPQPPAVPVNPSAGLISNNQSWLIGKVK